MADRRARLAPTASLDDRALELLGAILVELRAIRAEQRPQRSTMTLTPRDRETLARVLPAVAAYQGSAPFIAAPLRSI